MNRSPEKLIVRLKNRKGRIIGYSVLVVACLGLLVWNLFIVSRMITNLVPKEGDDFLMHVVVGQQVLLAIAFLQTITCLLALGLGVAAALLFTELTCFTKQELLVQLWDRVQALEQAKALPANSHQPQSPDAADQPSADG